MKITCVTISESNKFHQSVGFAEDGVLIKPTKVGEIRHHTVSNGDGKTPITRVLCNIYRHGDKVFGSLSLRGRVQTPDQILKATSGWSGRVEFVRA